MGLISRDGWALLDDTTTGRFDGAGGSEGGGASGGLEGADRGSAATGHDGAGAGSRAAAGGKSWDWVAPRDPQGLAEDRAALRRDGDPRCEQWHV